MKKLRFRDTLGQKMRILAFAALGFSAMASCQPKAHVKKNPLVEHKQTKTEAHEPVKGTWKDGECWIEGRDTIVYSYRIGKNKAEAKKFTADIFLEDGEKARDIKCDEKDTYVLTDRRIKNFPGAIRAYFGKGDFEQNGTITLGRAAKDVIHWLAQERELYIMTPGFFRFIPLDGRESRQVAGDFDESTRMRQYSGFLIIVRPGKEAFLMTYEPGDVQANSYKADPPFQGKVSFSEKKDHLLLKIGKEEITIEVKNEKIIVR